MEFLSRGTNPSFQGLRQSRPGSPHASQAWEREFLARYVATPHERVTLVRRLGVPADDVVAVAHETAAELLVLAWGQDLNPGRARVVSETLAHSDVPVLLIPTG